MEEILEKTIQLGCLLRDSPEGRAWRESQQPLSKISKKSWREMILSSKVLPIDEHLGLIHQANEVRPLLLPLVVNKYLPHMSHDEFRHELQKNQRIWNSYHQLELCSAFVALLVTFLRNLAPGYPHKDLIYTMPDGLWGEISSYKELPWNLAMGLIPNNSTDAGQIGLERVIPESAPAITIGVNLLAETVQRSTTWEELHKAYQKIAKQKNLQRELHRAKEQFIREFAPYQNPLITKATRFTKFIHLTKQIYAKRGKRILNYVDKFLEYEWLIECIYWTLSQLIMFEYISCISSSIPEQIQQVLLNYGQEAQLTALAKTRGRTLAAGQLIHITLPETANISDGLYQIETIEQRYDPKNGAHIFFRGRNLWYCDLNTLLSTTEKLKRPLCLQNETFNLLTGTRIKIMDGDNVVSTLEAGQFLQYRTSQTIYLP